MSSSEGVAELEVGFFQAVRFSDQPNFPPPPTPTCLIPRKGVGGVGGNKGATKIFCVECCFSLYLLISARNFCQAFVHLLQLCVCLFGCVLVAEVNFFICDPLQWQLEFYIFASVCYDVLGVNQILACYTDLLLACHIGKVA